MTNAEFAVQPDGGRAVVTTTDLCEPLFLDDAVRVGVGLTQGALWSGASCSWLTTTLDLEQPWNGNAKYAACGPFVYQGTAGIAMFLTELARVTGDRTFRGVAEGALRNSITKIPKHVWREPGFYSGWSGVAAALWRFGDHFRNEEFTRVSVDLMKSMEGREASMRGHDLMSGAAGAIPFLLDLSGNLGEQSYCESAIKIGEAIIASAKRWPNGWSWDSGPLVVARDLLGLAHGASGTASALVELFAATGDERFRYAAEQAFLYESQYYDDAERNWPDFRQNRITRALATTSTREAFLNVIGEDPSQYLMRKRFMVAWCHGAPGIGLTRLRAHVVLGSRRHGEEALIAAKTARDTARLGQDYSLCHGVFGSDAFLLSIARSLDPGFFAFAVESAAEATTRVRQGAKWPSGVLGNVPDASLFLGDAGIGYHLLNLAVADAPSILLPTIRAAVVPNDDAQRSATALKMTREDIDCYFGKSLRACRRMQLDHTIPSWTNGRDRQGAVVLVGNWLERVAREHPESPLTDASAVELQAFLLIETVESFADTVLATALRTAVDDVDWNTVRISLAPWARLVEERFDWDGWLSGAHESLTHLPEERQVLLYRVRDRVCRKEIGHFAYLVLRGVSEGAKLDEVSAFVGRVLDLPPSARLRERVLQQLRSAYEHGIVLTPLRPGVPSTIAERG